MTVGLEYYWEGWTMYRVVNYEVTVEGSSRTMMILTWAVLLGFYFLVKWQGLIEHCHLCMRMLKLAVDVGHLPVGEPLVF